ncbi:RNA polymerase sigma factor SigF [Acaryochloris thomasi]|nr:RNA polymerase sigma factor SigF [Acaryochloris thomasi]
MLSTCTQELKSESLQLLQGYQSNPSTQVRNKLVQMNLGLVRKEAHRWVHNSGENFEDLLQVGCFGLIQAIERFDLTKGSAFSSFATPYIRGEIQHYLRDKSPQVRIPRRWQELQRQAAQVTHRMRDNLQRQPTEAEVVEALGISLTEWQEAKVAMSNRSPLSLDMPIQQAESESTSLGDLLTDGHYRSFQLAQEDQIRVQQALAKLEKRTSQVLEFVFLYDLTQKETAERLGISAVTVSRQVKKGLTALRHLLKGADEATEEVDV